MQLFHWVWLVLTSEIRMSWKNLVPLLKVISSGYVLFIQLLQSEQDISK